MSDQQIARPQQQIDEVEAAVAALQHFVSHECGLELAV